MKKENKYQKILIFILIILINITSVLGSEWIRISPEEDIDTIPYLDKIPSKTRTTELKIILEDDGSVEETNEVKSIISDKEFINKIIVEEKRFSFSSEEDYESIEIFDLNKNIKFTETSILGEPPICLNKFAIDPNTNKVKFCIQISEEGEINYKIKTYINPDYDFKNTCSPNYIANDLNYSVNIPTYFSISFAGGENVILNYKENKSICESGEWKLEYQNIPNGFKCKGFLPTPPEGKDWGFEVNIGGWNKELKEKEKMEEKSSKEKRKELIGKIVFLFIVPVLCVFLTWYLTNKNKNKKFGKELKEIKENQENLEKILKKYKK